MHELRVRVVDLFADFDKLRSGHVPRATFRRALGATKLDLQESELSLLEDRCVCVCVCVCLCVCARSAVRPL